MKGRTRGEVIPQLCGVGLALIIIFLVVFEFARTCIISTDVQNSMRSAADVNITANKFYAYSSIREGLSGAYTVDGSGIHENIHTAEIQRIVNDLDLQNSGSTSTYVKMNGVQKEYSLSGLTVQISNPNAGDTGTYSITIKGTLSISLPLSLPPVPVPLLVEADFASKF